MESAERFLPTHIVSAGAVVLNDRGEVLLIKDDRRNSWTFPGGIVEEGEGLLDGVKREVLEETGIEIEVGELFCVTSNTCKHPGYNGVREVPPKVMLDFVCRAIGGTPRPISPWTRPESSSQPPPSRCGSRPIGSMKAAPLFWSTSPIRLSS